MIVLGVDPGLASLGWGVVEGPDEWRLDGCGTWRSAAKKPLETRLRDLASFIGDLVEAHAPERLALEWGGFPANARQSMLVGTAVGAIVAAVPRDLATVYMTPAQVKSGLTGYGNAPKDQVAYMVGQHVEMPAGADDHATDAVAIAITSFRGDYE